MKKLLTLLLLSHSLFLSTGCGIQRRMLYYPGQFHFKDIKQAATNNGMALWTQDSPYYFGIMATRKQFSYKGTIIVFHGNAGPAIFRGYYISALKKLGYRVILAEYPGYGGKPGKMTEKKLMAEARRTVELAVKEFGEPVYIWGESMGCGIVAGIISEETINIKGVVLLTPWDNLTNVARRDVPAVSISAGLIVKDKYDNVKNISKYKGPVAVIMAEKDEIIPNDLTINLYNSIKSRKKMFIFNNSGHNDWPNGPEQLWWLDIMTFLESK
ncbi:MAG: alpha/beta hydrolase [Elusimicrobia bacterium]|nr:alpha/beta hydrolase [Elusimicrobiota bacterium]